jgi:perosamine synthetase
MHKGKYSEMAILNASLSLQSDTNSTDGLPWNESFENNFMKFVGSDYAVSVNSGTSGLHASLLALGIGPGDEVISPALTVVMDAFATIYTGATPVFADVSPDTWNLDPVSVKSKITSKTKAIISVSWFGLPADLRELRKIADEHRIFLVDDSAETILTRENQPPDWNLPHLRVYSFESKKHMSTGGEGGMVTTDDEELATKVRKFAGIGYQHLGAKRGRTSLAAKIFQNPNYERFDTVGYNYRMTPLSAAVGVGQIDSLPKALILRQLCADIWREALDGCNFIRFQGTNGAFHSYYTFGIEFLGQEKNGVTWEDFYDRYTTLGASGFYANCLNPYRELVFRGHFQLEYDLDTIYCPVAEKLQKNIMAFKTNYVDLEVTKMEAKILSRVVRDLS